MELTEELFVAQNVTSLDMVVYALKRNIPVTRLYCVVFFPDKNQLEVIASRQLFTTRHLKRSGIIGGVALGRQEALDLVRYIVEEAVKTGKNLRQPKSWIMGEENEGFV